MTDPHALLPGAGAGGGWRVPPTPPASSPGRAAPGQSGLGATEPLLSVSLTPAGDNFCTLSKALMGQVPHLKGGGRVLLVVPQRRGGEWFLDTRPRPGAGSLVPGPPKRAFFRVPPIGRLHFMRPQAKQGTAQVANPRYPATEATPVAPHLYVANRNVLLPLLRFRLGAEVAGQPGYYQLLPEAESSAAREV